jgi:hypothetical protein
MGDLRLIQVGQIVYGDIDISEVISEKKSSYSHSILQPSILYKNKLYPILIINGKPKIL